MNTKEFFAALELLEKEKGISKDIIIDAIHHFDQPKWGTREGRMKQLQRFSSWTNSAKVFLSAINDLCI